MPLTATGLYAPQSFLEAPAGLVRKVCNGCGSALSKFDFVPDTVWGLRISEACRIHDWMYFCGRGDAQKLEADVVFLGNLLRIIERAEGVVNRILRWPRRIRALTYYQAVVELGGTAYMAGK